MKRILTKDRRDGVEPTKFGGVVNLGGVHYVAVYFDVKARTAEYFDSIGNPLPPRVRAFLDQAIAHLKKKHGVSFRLLVLTIRHLKGDRECGMYVCYFVLQRLLGRSFAWTQREVVPDARMRELRRVYFRT
jgi:Ulp1 family protease